MYFFPVPVRAVTKPNRSLLFALAWLFFPGAQAADVDCVIAEETKRLDPVEVGFCESDVVFVARVESKTDTEWAVSDEDTGGTKHLRTQRATLQVLNRLKGKPAEKVTMVTQMYDKNRAFVFESGKEYLVFARKLPGDHDYVGASAKCSVQSTLLLSDAERALKQLVEHANGKRTINCKRLREKPAS